jgi:hypothetical protein
MDEQARGLVRIIEALASRSEAETLRLARVLLRRSWPGDVADRREPGAVEWVRRWGPQGPAPLPPGCSCATGRCGLCN